MNINDGKGKEKSHCSQKREELSSPQPTPVYKLSMISMVWHWPAGASCLLVLPPSSCRPAHQLNVGDWKNSLIS